MNLRDYQSAGEPIWSLPAWNHPIGQGIMPLFIRSDDRMIPVGTAFLISRFGLVACAAHCIYQALRYRRYGTSIADAFDAVNNEYDLDDVGLSVLHHSLKDDGRTSISLWPLEHVRIGPPSDVVYASLLWAPDILKLSFTLSPGVPRVGKTLLSVGYTEFAFPEGGLPIDRITEGRFDWEREYSHSLRVCEGLSGPIFTQQYSRGYVDGPCILTTCETVGGQSGGPVFNEEGNVCAIVSAGTQVTGSPGSIASTLYPTLPLARMIHEK